jgi:phosphocarrier protein HPr
MSVCVEKTVTVINPLGIHMRPADMLSRAAGKFQCSIEIEKDGQSIDCKSIMSILTLGARQGTQLFLRANGPDAQQAIEALVELIEQGFDELDSQVASPGRAS